MDDKTRQIATQFHEEQRQLLIRMGTNDIPYQEHDEALLELRDRYLRQVYRTDDKLGIQRAISETRFSLADQYDIPFPKGLQLFLERYNLGFDDNFDRAHRIAGFYAYCRDQGRLEVALPYLDEVLNEAEEGFASDPEKYRDLCESFRTFRAKILKSLGSDQ